VTYKVQLFSRGGLIFKDRSRFLISDTKEKNFQNIEVQKAPSPSGGSWGQSPAVLLQLREEDLKNCEAGIASIIGLSREDFPKLDGEVYLCDVLGLDVVDENFKSYGRVVAYQEVDLRNPDLINLSVEMADKKTFEFPWSWVDWQASGAAKLFPENRLVVPSVAEWVGLK